VSGVGKAELIVSRKIRVLNSEGKKYCNVIISESKFRKFKSFTGKVYGSDQQLIYTLEKNDVERVCGYSGYALYADVCYRLFEMSTSSYPFIVEYEYKVAHNSIFFWPDWKPKKEIPVRLSKYNLIVPKNLEFNTKEIGSIPPASVSEHKGKMTYSYELTEMPACETENFAFSIGEEMISLRFSPVKYKLEKYLFDGRSWHGLGKDCHEMMKKSFVLNNEQKAYMEKILDGAGTQREICERLHESLSANTRYVAIEIGVGSWQPSSSRETFERGYGDCKDLSVMYVSMLRHVGIDAKPVLIRTKGHETTDPGFPTLSRFNHVILFSVADGDTLWIDPTCRQCRVGDLPSPDEDVFVLAIDSAGGQIIRTPASSADDNIIARKASVKINEDKSISVRLEFRTAGNPYHWLIWFLNTAGKRELDWLLKKEMFGLSGKFSTDKINLLVSDVDSSDIKISVLGKVRNSLHSIGEKLYLDLNFISPFRKRESIALSDRTQVLDLEYPQTRIDSLFITIPENWRPLESSLDTTIADQFGSLHIRYKLLGDSLVISRVRKSYDYMVNPEDFADYEEHIDRFAEAAECRVAFIKKP